jgi:ABC-2 type transport system ATP-binding protein
MGPIVGGTRRLAPLDDVGPDSTLSPDSHPRTPSAPWTTPSVAKVILVEHVSKRYGSTLAVDDLTFSIPPGRVTGFLGPNGAGKSTTMRLILGLDRPSAGTVTVNGTPYRHHRFPLTEVGALLEANAIHPGRSARNHLRWLAASNGLPARRADEVLEQVGLHGVARKRAGGFSLGMGQRLGIAAALLGDPGVLLLDEPVNGLDPEGIQWVRHLLRGLAAEGRTVFVSSHLMSEMALTADHLVVIGRGRLIADATVREVIDRSTTNQVYVASPHLAELAPLVARAGGVMEPADPGSMLVSGLGCREIGTLAGAAGLTLFELSPRQASLEEAFMEMTRDSGEFRAADDRATVASVGP